MPFFVAFSMIGGGDAFQPTRTQIKVNAATGTHPLVQNDGILKASKGDQNNDVSYSQSRRKRIRDKVSTLAKKIVTKPITAVAPQAIASILTDSTLEAVDLALDEVNRIGTIRKYDDILEKEVAMERDTAVALDTIALAKTTAADAFALAETAIEETEEALRKSKLALAQCRKDVANAIAIAEKSAYQANMSSQKATLLAASAAINASEEAVARKEAEEIREEAEESVHGRASAAVLKESSEQILDGGDIDLDITELDYKDVDYHLSEMAPPFIGEDQCLVPGEAVVRVEKARDNSRRIFAGIDILASVDDVWEVSFGSLVDMHNVMSNTPFYLRD